MNCIIVDDEPGARKLLEEYIGDIDFLQLVGKAENPLKANALLSSQQIDLLFLDVNMPKMSGIEVAYRIKQSHSQTKIVFLTLHDDFDFRAAALETGAYSSASEIP